MVSQWMDEVEAQLEQAIQDQVRASKWLTYPGIPVPLPNKTGGSLCGESVAQL
jgi:hypothetical protein